MSETTNATNANKLVTLSVMQEYNAAKEAEHAAMIKELADSQAAMKEELEASHNEMNVKLAEDLYTYTDVGMITGASNTTPVLIASVGSTIKEVFTRVFGEQQDQDPSIVCSTNVEVADGDNAFGSGEFGNTVAATTATITFTLKNRTGTCSYGYRVGDTKYPNSKTVYYPITKHAVGDGKTADLRIALPEGKTASADMVTTANAFVAADGRYLYCNFVGDKVSIQVSLTAGNVGATVQDRYGVINGTVVFGNAQTAATDGSDITSFLTFLGRDYEDDDGNKLGLDGTDMSKNTSKYTINSGSKYNYYQVTDSATTPGSTGWTSMGTKCVTTKAYTAATESDGFKISANAGQYIWFATTSNVTSAHELNELSGKYNGAVTLTKVASQTLVNSVNYTCTNMYNFYCLPTARAGSGEATFIIR
jgi:hypothetical protein